MSSIFKVITLLYGNFYKAIPLFLIYNHSKFVNYLKKMLIKFGG